MESMIRRLLVAGGVVTLVASTLVGVASALSVEHWTNATPYGLFFNDYDPNFYTGFVPRVQEAARIKIHLARGNQLRVRMAIRLWALCIYGIGEKSRQRLRSRVRWL